MNTNHINLLSLFNYGSEMRRWYRRVYEKDKNNRHYGTKYGSLYLSEMDKLIEDRTIESGMIGLLAAGDPPEMVFE